jgi:hypothetical protein
MQQRRKPSYAYPAMAKLGERRRLQGMSEKHRTLAAFVSDKQAQAFVRREVMALWNVSYPQWAYTSVGRFNREADQACLRVEANQALTQFEQYARREVEGMTTEQARVMRRLCEARIQALAAPQRAATAYLKALTSQP